MIAKNKSTWLAAILLISMSAESIRAQDYYSDDFGDSDLQFFAPVDFDFNDRPLRKDSGYIFNFEKLNWSMTGERTRLGTDGTTDGSFNPWREFWIGAAVVPDPTDPDSEEGVIFPPGVSFTIPAPFLPSGISTTAPRAEFGWGDRYEIGYHVKGNGWVVGILDGPESSSVYKYGYGFTGQNETTTALGANSPVPPFDYTPPGEQFDPNIQGSGTPFIDSNTGQPVSLQSDQLFSPLGSVLIVFDDPLNLMRGFIDVVNATGGDTPGRVLGSDTNGDGVLDGDGFADDINKNGQHGADGFDLETPAEEPDSFLLGGTPADFDDLVTLPTSFQEVHVRNSTALAGVEIMRKLRLSNRHHMDSKQGNEVEMSYGVRYLRLHDQFIVNGYGGVLGTSFWDTVISNNLVGPQIGLKWHHQRKRWGTEFGGRFLFGYNIQNFEQTAALGEDLIPGQNNHPLYFSPTYSTHGKQENDFSPLVEMRMQASYQVTSAIAVKLGYSATFVDNIRRASQHVRYELPNMGFRDGGTQEIFINGVNFGFDLVY